MLQPETIHTFTKTTKKEQNHIQTNEKLHLTPTSAIEFFIMYLTIFNNLNYGSYQHKV